MKKTQTKQIPRLALKGYFAKAESYGLNLLKKMFWLLVVIQKQNDGIDIIGITGNYSYLWIYDPWVRAKLVTIPECLGWQEYPDSYSYILQA